MVNQYPCVHCDKSVKKNQKALLCTECNLWAHIKCAGISDLKYNDPNEGFVNWQCSKCVSSYLPFFNDNVDEFVKVPKHTPDYEPSNESTSSDHNVHNSGDPRVQFPKEKGAKIAHLNIRSLRNRRDEFAQFLHDCPYDVMSLSETWLDKDICHNLVSIEGYKFERKDRTQYGGGVGCYIRENIPYLRRHDLENDNLELLWIELKPRNETSLFVGVIYRPPSSPMSFFDALEINLDKVTALSDKIVLLGDFNSNMLTANPLSKTLNDLSELNGFSQLIDKPTRVTPNSSTLIDLIFVSKSLGELKSGVLSLGLSDHSLVYVITRVTAPRLTPQISSFRSFRHFQENAFLDELQAIDWNEKLQTHDDVDGKWKEFHSTFLELCNKHAPYITVRKKITVSPWITTQYIELARERDFNKKKFNETRDVKYWDKYRVLRNKANNFIKKLKRQYYSDQLGDYSKDLKKKWSILKQLLPSKKSNNNPNIVVGGEIITDSHKIASDLNTLFSNVGKLASAKANGKAKQKGKNKKSGPKMSKRIKSKFVFEEISSEFVHRELSKLDCTKSVGLDDLHPRLLKVSAHLIASPIALIFNHSIQTGHFPQDFKLAKIIPIPKSESSNDINNYRPISLLSIVSKVFERAVHSQLLSFLKKENLLSERQSGFRPKHSTSTCLTEICDFLYEHLDKGRLIGAVFLDLRKAFDIIPHDLLIKKLSSYGLDGIALKWFESYLKGRQQCVSFKGATSDFLPVYSGVPQGSILGPLLFCIYINEISDLPLHPQTKISLYADDTAIFSSGFGVHSVQKQLQADIKVISQWFLENGLIVNTDKTKVMLFASSKRKKTAELNIVMDGELLEKVTKFKYLGVVVDQNLDWTPHVNEVIKKLCSSVACIRRIRHCVTKSTLTQLYYSLFLPHIDYCCTAWGCTTKTNLGRLQRCQNKFARLVLNAEYRTSTVSLLDALKWQSIEKRLSYQYCIMAYKSLNDMGPPYLSHLLSRRNVVYSTRHVESNQLYLPIPKTENKKRSFSYKASKLFNSLPLHVQSSSTLEVFKKRLRAHQYTC